ncbi:MAG: phosphoribosylanthranilate isomerase [Pseudomonadota bacterium]
MHSGSLNVSASVCVIFRRMTSTTSMRTQIKICGFTRAADAVQAVALGADALGLVFYPPSSRNISIERAIDIAREVAPFTSLTALFLNAERAQIESVLAKVPISLLQFHGTEEAEFCRSFNRPYIKAVPMKSVDSVEAYCDSYHDARGFLLDSNAAGAAGGSGKAFDWSRIPQTLPAGVILAGGLTVDNVHEAVSRVRPSAVDTSSGVESAKGIKDAALMRDFIQQVKAADVE